MLNTSSCLSDSWTFGYLFFSLGGFFFYYYLFTFLSFSYWSCKFLMCPGYSAFVIIQVQSTFPQFVTCHFALLMLLFDKQIFLLFILIKFNLSIFSFKVLKVFVFYIRNAVFPRSRRVFSLLSHTSIIFSLLHWDLQSTWNWAVRLGLSLIIIYLMDKQFSEHIFIENEIHSLLPSSVIFTPNQVSIHV